MSIDKQDNLRKVFTYNLANDTLELRQAVRQQFFQPSAEK